MFKYFIILINLVVFVSCGGFDNPRDPKNICGGISLEDPLKMRSNGVQVISAQNTTEGIQSTISLNLTNCTGFDFSNSNLEINSLENTNIDSFASTVKVNELSPNQDFSAPVNIFLRGSDIGTTDMSYSLDFSTGASGQTHKQIDTIKIPDLKTKVIIDKVVCSISSLNLDSYNATCTMTLKNDGYASTEDLVILLNSINNGASITSDLEQTLASIGGKDKKVNVNFSLSAPDINKTYKLGIQITDKYSNAWSETVSFIISSKDKDISFVSSTIVADQSGDGVLSAGEYAYVKIKIKNTSSQDLYNVSATITAPAGVTLLNPENKLYFGDIESGNSACGNDDEWSLGSCDNDNDDYLKVSLDVSFNNGSQVPFIMNLTDNTGKTRRILGKINTAEPNINLSLYDVELLGDQNRDGLISAGEYAYLKIKVKNTGLSKIFGLTGTVTSTNNNVQIQYYSNNTVLYFWDVYPSNINCGGAFYYTGCSSDPGAYLKVFVSPIHTNGVNIPFVINLTDSMGNNWSFPFEVPTAPPLVDLNISNVIIVSEQVANGRLSTGEYGHLQIKVKNTGTADSITTTGTLTVNNPNVSVSYYSGNTKIYFGTIQKNSARCGYISGLSGYCETSSGNPKIIIGPGVVAGTNLLFTLNLEDAFGNTYTKQFTMTVNSPSLNVTSNYSLMSDSNGNSLIEPGENLYLKLNINNVSPFFGSLLYVTLSEVGTNYLTLTDASSYFGYVNGYESYCGTANGNNMGNCSLSFSNYNRVSVSPITPNNSNINLQAVLRDSFGNTIGTYVYTLQIQ